MVGSHLQGRNGLIKLASVCKALQNILTPMLYKDDMDNNDCDALSWGCLYGKLEVVKAAIQHGQPIEHHFERHHNHPLANSLREGMTPLTLAVRGLKCNVVDYLIKQGANVNRPDMYPISDAECSRHGRWFPINWVLSIYNSSCTGNKEYRYVILERLLEAGAHVDQLPLEYEEGKNEKARKCTEGPPIAQATEDHIPTKALALLLKFGADPMVVHTLYDRFGHMTQHRCGDTMRLLVQSLNSWSQYEAWSKFMILKSHLGDSLASNIHDILEITVLNVTPLKIKLLKELFRQESWSAKVLLVPIGGFPNALELLVHSVSNQSSNHQLAESVFEESGKTYTRVQMDLLHFFLSTKAQFDGDSISRTMNRLCCVKDMEVDDAISTLLRLLKETVGNEYTGFSDDTDYECTALHFACDGDGYEWDYPRGSFSPLPRAVPKVWSFTQSGWQVNVRDWYGLTPLHHICQSCDTFADPYETIQLLLECGASVDARTTDEETPLHLLCSVQIPNVLDSEDYPRLGRRKQCIEALLQHGASLTAKACNGQNALQFAESVADHPYASTIAETAEWQDIIMMLEGHVE